jgi:hypothetical protein
MNNIKAFLKSHPVLTYFVLVFAISWGGFLIAAGVGTGGFSPSPEQLQTLIPYAVPAMLLGPSVAGILLTSLLNGRAGLRESRNLHVYPHALAGRGALLGHRFRVRRRGVGRRCSARLGPRRASIATTTPEACDLTEK